MKTEIETVPLGDVQTIFYKHGVSEAATTGMITFLIKVWLGNEHEMHADLTKECINLLELDELSTNMLIIEALPELLNIAALVHDAQQGRSLAAVSVKTHVISLEFFA